MYTLQGQSPLSQIERAPHGASLKVGLRGLGQVLMKRGTSALEVFELAEKLEQMGYPMGPRPDPNLFDDSLEQAVMLFQREHGLPAVGTVDGITLNMIDRDYETGQERPTGMMATLTKAISLFRTPKRMVEPVVDKTGIWPGLPGITNFQLAGIVVVVGFIAYKTLSFLTHRDT